MKLTKSIEESQVCGFSMYRGVGHLPSLKQLWEIKADLVKIKVPWSTYLSTLNERGLPYPCFLSCKVWRLETALNQRPSIKSEMGIRFKELTVQDYDTLISLIGPSNSGSIMNTQLPYPMKYIMSPEIRKRATEAYMYSYCQATGGRIGWLIYKDNSPIGYNVGVDRGDGLFEGEHVAILPEFRNRGIGQYLYQYFTNEVLPSLGFRRFQNYIQSDNLPSLRSAEQAGLQQKEGYAFVTLTPFLNQEHWSPVVNASDERNTGIELSWVGAGYSKEGRNLYKHSNPHIQEVLSPQFILYNNNLEGVSYTLKNLTYD